MVVIRPSADPWAPTVPGSLKDRRLAHLEGGIELLITDCVSTLSPIQWHLDGRAVGFFVGVHRSELGTDGEHIDLPDRFAYACSETARRTPRQSAIWCRRR